MIRIYAALILTLSGFLISRELYRKKERIYLETEEAAETVSKIISELGYTRDDVYTVSKEAAGFELRGISFPGEWEAECKKRYVGEDGLKIMQKAGNILGSADLDSQLERLRLLRDEALRTASEKKARLDSEKRLYLTLGLSLGAAIGIMMI